MYVLDLVCNTSSSLRIFYVVKMIIASILFFVPVITVISCSITLLKQIIANEVSKDLIMNIIKKIVACALVFLVIPIHNTIMDSLGKQKLEDNNCWINATDSYIESLRLKEEAEMEAREKLKAEEELKRKLEKEIAEKERLAQLEKDKQNNNSTTNNTGSTGGSTGGTTSDNTPGYSGGVSYGKGCTNFVSSSTYNAALANQIIANAKTKIGTPYSKMDCSDFVSFAYKNYVPDSTAAGLAQNTKGKCVKAGDIKPGDVFFTSRYNKNGTCTNCVGSTFGNRCNRWNCILHVGIVLSVSNGKVTSILHSSNGGVQIKTSPSYKFSPNSNGSAWYIMITRPYA